MPRPGRGPADGGGGVCGGGEPSVPMMRDGAGGRPSATGAGGRRRGVADRPAGRHGAAARRPAVAVAAGAADVVSR